MRKVASSVLCTITLFFLAAGYVLAQTPPNPVIWKTAYNEFSSSDFYIQIGQTSFLGSGNVRVHADPGVNRSTLELDWEENNVTMRLYFYFEKVENGMWQLYDLRTYNSQGSDWIYYNVIDTSGNPVKAPVGQRDYRSERTFSSKDGSAKIFCKECGITAFISTPLNPSVHGYSVDFRIGIPQNETITITNDPMTGYGVNAVLMDTNGGVVTNQTDFSYSWKTENDSVLSLHAQGVPYPDGNCAYGIQAPCPEFNVQITGKNPGISRVLLEVIRQSDNAIIASNTFSVKVIDKSPSPFPTSTPAPVSTPIRDATPTATPGTVVDQLEELRGEVGRLSKTVERQQTDVNLLMKIIQAIQAFFLRVFGVSL